MRRMVVPVAVSALVTVLAGCGSGVPGASTSGDPSVGEEVVLLGSGLVLDDGDGPELCLGGVLESYPPQCGGPRLVGWDWDQVEGEVRASGTTWGDYVVIGTYDGERFTLTRRPVGRDEYDGPRPRPLHGDEELETPCPEPPGGWRPVDPERTTESALQQVARAADRLDGFADLWWDQSVNPAYDDPDSAEREYAMNDPAKLVVNVRVVGDAQAAEAELREVWGGALCVTEARRTREELRDIQQALADTPGLLFSEPGRDVVDIQVVHDDGSLQRRLDERYGAGVVRVRSALTPLAEVG